MTWPLEKIWEMVAPIIPGFSVELLPEIDSTNSELMRRARVGRCDPVLLIAETQTAGRGRMGKSWQSRTSGQSLCFSLGIPLQVQSWSGFSLAVGLAVAQGLDPDGDIGMQIKWPNDIWVKSKKLAGILIETANLNSGLPYVVIGIGVNITKIGAQSCDSEHASSAVDCIALQDLTLHSETGCALQRIMTPLVTTVQQFATQGFAPFVPDYQKRDCLRGNQVYMSDGRSGKAMGVAPDGALLVKNAMGHKERISSLEVSVRPYPPVAVTS